MSWRTRFFSLAISLAVCAGGVLGLTAASAQAGADVRVVLAGPTSGAVGETLVYTATISNIGDAPASDVRTQITFQAFGPLVFDSVSVSSGGTCERIVYDGGSTVRCVIGAVAAGASVTETVRLRVGAQTTDIVSVSATSSADSDESNNTGSIIVFPPSRPKPPPAQVPRPVVAKWEMPTAYVGEPYSERIVITDGTPPYHVAYNPCYPTIPGGFSLSDEGVISGVPIASGKYLICIIVSDAYWTNGATIASMTVEAVVRPPLLVETASRTAKAAVAYDAAVVSGGRPPFTISLNRGMLPPGLALSLADGHLKGRPVTSGTFSFSLRVQDANGATATGSLEVFVRAQPGFATRPNAQLTPGSLNPRVRQTTVRQTICSPAWLEAQRPAASFDRSITRRITASYGLGSASGYVLDRLVPIELGGSPHDARNIWPQLPQPAKARDRLEHTLHTRICNNTITLAHARALIISLKRSS